MGPNPAVKPGIEALQAMLGKFMRTMMEVMARIIQKEQTEVNATPIGLHSPVLGTYLERVRRHLVHETTR